MQHYNSDQLASLPLSHCANLVNSCTGLKSANLIATRSADGVNNVAIFSSVTHIGSNPPLMGLIVRPLSVERHSYHNIRRTQYFTVNHVTEPSIASAHQSAAKYAAHESEFDHTGLTPEFKADFHAPFVAGSPVQLGCRFIRAYSIEENGCWQVIGSIEHIFVKPGIQTTDRWINLDKAGSVAVGGLDSY